MAKLNFKLLILLIALVKVAVCAETDGCNCDEDTQKNTLAKTINDIDNEIIRILSSRLIRKPTEKRSDIDERLLELHSKISLAREYAKIPVGHGRFNFDEIGKRSDFSDKFNRIMKLQE